MPYKSKAQVAAFHAKLNAGEIKPSVVSEFDKASKGKMGNLPEHVKPKGKSLKETLMGKLKGE